MGYSLSVMKNQQPSARTLLLRAFAVSSNLSVKEARITPSVFEAAERSSGQSVGDLLRRASYDKVLRDFFVSEIRRIAALPQVDEILAEVG